MNFTRISDDYNSRYLGGLSGHGGEGLLRLLSFVYVQLIGSTESSFSRSERGAEAKQ